MEENRYGKPSPKIPPIALMKSVLVWAVLSLKIRNAVVMVGPVKTCA
jgi:hypothetical protein